MTRVVSVYRRPTGYLLCPMSTLVSGAGLATPPIVALPPDAATGLIGTTALELIGACQEKVPLPADWAQAMVPLLRAAKARSWKTFARGTLLVDVLERSNGWEIVPSALDRAGGAFEHRPEKSARLPRRASARELGEGIVNALNRCEAVP